MPQRMRSGFFQADNHIAVLDGAQRHIDYRFGAHYQTVYVDERVPYGEVILGHCETVAGYLAFCEALMHPAFAAHLAKYSTYPILPSEEQPMAADIEHKTFTVKREEWFVPTGDYRDQYGACWTDLMLAINCATNRLGELGEFNGEGEPASDQIKVVPHDAHVVVRIEYTQERK